MPELPDVTVYLEALESRLLGQTLERAVLKNPFLLRTADPPLQSCEGRRGRGAAPASASASRSASTTIAGW